VEINDIDERKRGDMEKGLEGFPLRSYDARPSFYQRIDFRLKKKEEGKTCSSPLFELNQIIFSGFTHIKMSKEG